MDFTFTEPQRMFRDSVATFARKELAAGALARAHTPEFPRDAARLLLYRAATNADKGFPAADETTIAKLMCNQTGFDVANEALQIMGGGWATRRRRWWSTACAAAAGG